MDMLRTYVKLIVERVKSTGNEPFSFQKFKKVEKFDPMLKYADLHLDDIGEGSSRKVYVFTGNKVLKVATNPKGLAQNEQEVDVFTNPKTKPLIARIYDYDPEYAWIVSELTRPIDSEDEADDLVGGDFELFAEDAATGDFEEIDEFYDDPKVKQLARAIHAVASSNNLKSGDIGKSDSWGKTPDGRLVLIDYGYSDSVHDEHYATDG